jgi:hypothetical protein
MLGLIEKSKYSTMPIHHAAITLFERELVHQAENSLDRQHLPYSYTLLVLLSVI